MRIAFSTVATPDWSLPRLARGAGEWGYQGLELRTFGSGSREFASDPALTDPAKTREVLAEAGLHAACLSTGVAFDEPIHPPVIGRVGDTEASIRRAKEAIELAQSIACPFVRVFGFELHRSERRDRGIARITERLALAADAARHTGVRLVVENGGSFLTSGDLIELVDRVGSPNLGACYSLAVAQQAGEDPLAGITALGERLWVAKIKDRLDSGQPCLPSDGVVPCSAAVTALARARSRAWLSFEWDRAWLPGIEPPEQVLPEAAARLFAWMGGRPEATETTRLASALL